MIVMVPDDIYVDGGLWLGSGIIDTSRWRRLLGWIRGKCGWLVTPFRMSRLTARIMAIMLFPLAVFLVGLLSLDQYRTTLIQSEFVALERQGFTLARSLALAEAERDRRVARRQLSPETMTHLIPLVGLGSSLRARVFQPNGSLLADTARRSGFQPNVDIRRHRDKSWRQKIRNNLNDMLSQFSSEFMNIYLIITDIYTIRRIVDKPYCTNAIVYVGGYHTWSMMYMLIKYFNFKLLTLRLLIGVGG